MANEIIAFQDIIVVLTGIFMGTLARFITLEVDYRQNPSYPSGYFINLVTGFIAAALGAIAIPAFMYKDYAAVTFLALAVQHFRDIRKIESESLSKLEHTEFSKRGHAYIDGIAKTYESRNYVSMLVSFITVLAMTIIQTQLIFKVIIGILAGFLFFIVSNRFIKGKSIGDICEITAGKIEVRGSELYVDNMFVTNTLGAERSRKLFEKEGIAVVIHPKDQTFRITLDNYGQRQAILFEAVRAFGVKRFKFMRKSFSQGKVIIAFVPIVHNIDRLIEVVKKTPILENSRKIHRIMNGR